MACRSDRHESGVGRPAIHSGWSPRDLRQGRVATSNPRPPTTMTDDSIALRALLEKSAEADLLREAPARPAFEGALLEPLDAASTIASGAAGSGDVKSCVSGRRG